MSETNEQRVQRIKATQRHVGAKDDGFWGPDSNRRCQAHLRELSPRSNPWPRSDQKSLQAFYGSPGDESQLVAFDFPYPTFYEGKRVTKGRCHRKVKDSLLRVLTRVGDRFKGDRSILEEAEDYGGIYNFRPMRNSSTPSLHARGAAIDLDADDNGNLAHWPTVADMPIELMEEFAREGWCCAGAFWNRDAMHFQATSGW